MKQRNKLHHGTLLQKAGLAIMLSAFPLISVVAQDDYEIRHKREMEYNNKVVKKLRSQLNGFTVPRPDSLLTDLRTENFPIMKEVVNNPIPGAPLLSTPQRIDGSKWEIRTEEHGLIYPILFDWNGDGLQDLICGEFLTGQSRMKVYLNTGTKKKPKFTGEWFYATDTEGNVMSNYEWCCIGIHPQIVDLDQDGYPDIISGQYYPGLISWWRGSEKGFLPRQYIEQEYYVEGKRYKSTEPYSPMSHNYWNYTTARFADFNGDGLLDLFVGGNGGLRVALNVGTKEHPKLGVRQPLYHVDGRLLFTNRDPALDVNVRLVPSEICGDSKTMLNPVDWDGDGVLDILATVGYTNSGQDGIYFLRGRQTQDGLRFEEPRPLVVSKDGSKLFPGCCPQIQVCDYNGDGVPDLMLGLAIPTTGEMHAEDSLAYQWVHDLNIQFPGKDCGENIKYFGSVDSIVARMEKEPMMVSYFCGKLTDLKCLTLRHRGYPFVMLGKPNPLKALALPAVAQRKEVEMGKLPVTLTTENPVTYTIEYPKGLTRNDNFLQLSFILRLLEGYHVYTPSKMNADFIPTTVEIELPEGLVFFDTKNRQSDKPFHTPATQQLGGHEIYKVNGDELQWTTMLRVDFSKIKERTVLPIKIKAAYQACNSQQCLPPEDIEETIYVTVVP